ARAADEPEALVAYPPRSVLRNAPAPSYAFLVHYTHPDDLDALDPALRELDGAERARFFDFTAKLPAGLLMRAPTVHSPTGAAAEGVILALGLLPEEMGRRGVCRDIERAVDLAAALGARRVGLGGYTVPYSRRGTAVAGRGPAITTGNSLTAGMAFAATQRMVESRNGRLRDTRVAIVGARGSVGALCARLFARARPRGMVLVGNPGSGVAHLQGWGGGIEWAPRAIEVPSDLTAVADCGIVVSATASASPVLDDAPLSSGSIICDVARPYDASPRVRARTDLTVIDGGLVALPDPTLRFGAGNLQGLPDGVQVAC